MTYRKQLLITTAILAMAPLAAQGATTYQWNTTTGNWNAAGNWTPNTGTPGSATNDVANIIGTTTLGSVTLTANLANTLKSMTVGGGAGFNDTLTINTGLTLKSTATTLSGGTITGLGTLSSAVSGFGTLNTQLTGSLTATGGTLDLQHSATVSGSFSGATISSTGTLQIDSGATLTLNNGNSEMVVNTGGTVNLNGGTIAGGTGSFGNYFGGGGNINVQATSALSGSIGNDTTNHPGLKPINIGGSLPSATLNLNTFTDGGVSFSVGAGGTLNDNQSGTTSLGNGSSIALSGGKVTNTGGGLFTFSGPGTISGFGTVSGLTSVLGGSNVTASGGTLTFIGGSTAAPTNLGGSGAGMNFNSSAGSVLDLQGNYNLQDPGGAFPGGGVVQFDGATITGTGGATAFSINGGGPATTGTFDVVGSNTSTLNNVAFSTGNGANLKVDAPLTVMGGGSVNATNVTVGGTGALNLNNTTGTTTLTTNNLTLANGSTLSVAAGHNGISLTGNFSFAQTDTVHGWTNGGTNGLGPDLTMTGKNNTLEAGGKIGGGYSQNFALDSLTLGSNAFIALVNQFANAAQGYGTEALYVDNLFGVLPGPGVVIPTLNLDGISAFDQSCPLTDLVCGPGGQLSVGLYTDALGGEINIINNPEPATLAVLATGLLGLGLIRRRRQN